MTLDLKAVEALEKLSRSNIWGAEGVQVVKVALPELLALAKIGLQARHVNAHWNEFGPEHGFDEEMDRLHKAIASYNRGELNA